MEQQRGFVNPSRSFDEVDRFQVLHKSAMLWLVGWLVD
jgi:hypothetical protein